MNKAGDQLSEIHAMLVAGHRSVQLERHSLVLWGVTGGFLAAFTGTLISEIGISRLWLLGLAQSLFIAVVLAIAAFIDLRLTRKARCHRDETLSFVQRQLQKMWIFLVLLGVSFTFGSFFFGGGYMVYGAWMFLAGLALYLHGLFSQQMLSWAGGLMMVAAVAGTALLPVESLRWFTAGVFALGLPMLGAMSGGEEGIRRRIAYSVIWLGVVTATALAATRFTTHDDQPGNELPTMSLNEYLAQPIQGSALVHLPAGTGLPLNIRLKGDLIEGETIGTIPITLSHDLDIAVQDGQGDGRFRVDENRWSALERRLRIPRVQRSLTLQPTGPKAEVEITVNAVH